jgi:hypothetical protein
MACNRIYRLFSRPLLCAALGLVAAALPAPILAQSRGCPAKAPTTDANVTKLLQDLTDNVNRYWATAAAGAPIDPLEIQTGNIVTACPSDGGTLCFFSAGLTNCLHTTSYFNISELTGLSQLRFSTLVAQFNAKDAAAHLESGPDASKIADGVFAPEGASWNHPSYAVVLGSNDVRHALTIDLGTSTEICGDDTCGPLIQADKHSFKLDYSIDGTQWTPYAVLPGVSGDGLRTRRLQQSVPNQQNPPFTARYIRIYGYQGSDTNYSVSEVQLRDTGGNIVAVGGRAIGPRPFRILDGVLASEGTTWNNTAYAVVLRNEGAASALVIDLGAPVSVCGGVATCGPQIQADKNEYQFDYSLDGINWVPYSTLPTVSDTGLRTRGLLQVSAGVDNPDFTARYVRIWGLSGDGNYSVSEVILHRAGGGEVLTASQTYGPEALATNGEVAPEGTDWNNASYASILSPCAQSSYSTCANGSALGATAGMLVDLTANFPISQLTIQADRHPYQIDYWDGDESSGRWQALWTVPEVDGSGLRTREYRLPTSPSVRHLLVYGLPSDDMNYSVSSLQVLTPAANTPCVYSGAANVGQDFSCTYDGTLSTQVTLPNQSLPVSFTVDSAGAYLRCTNGTADGSTPPKTVPPGTLCSAVLTITAPTSGELCSGYCSSGELQSVLTLTQLDSVSVEMSDMQCDHDIDSDLAKGVLEVAQASAAQAVQDLFNGLVRTKSIPGGPMVPSGTCAMSSGDSLLISLLATASDKIK